MDERWRRPIDVLDVSPHPYEVVELPDGRLMRGAEVVLMKESIERIRLGYICLNCFEPQEHAFPENCSLCGYPMREEQSQTFERELVGPVRMGSRTTIAGERERLREDT
jgi:hypothetical protein